MEPLKSTDIESPVPTTTPLSAEEPRKPNSGKPPSPKSSRFSNPRMARSGPVLLNKILSISLILAEDWLNQAAAKREAVERCVDAVPMLEILVTEGLLTP